MRLLDLGGGIGGPAAWLHAHDGCRPIVAEPARAGPAAARRLFDLPGVVCLGPLPFAATSFDAAWALATLSTVDDLAATLDELHDVLRPGAGLGLQEYVRRAGDEVRDPPPGNRFLSQEELVAALDRAGFDVRDVVDAADLPDPPEGWRDDEQAVDDLLTDRHGGSDALADSRATADHFARLLADGTVSVRLVHARRR
jgi:SAM-dependent methyltransferase